MGTLFSLEKNDVLTHATAWINHENNMLSERR